MTHTRRGRSPQPQDRYRRPAPHSRCVLVRLQRRSSLLLPLTTCKLKRRSGRPLQAAMRMAALPNVCHNGALATAAEDAHGVFGFRVSVRCRVVLLGHGHVQVFLVRPFLKQQTAYRLREGFWSRGLCTIHHVCNSSTATAPRCSCRLLRSFWTTRSTRSPSHGAH